MHAWRLPTRTFPGANTAHPGLGLGFKEGDIGDYIGEYIGDYYRGYLGAYWELGFGVQSLSFRAYDTTRFCDTEHIDSLGRW